MEWVIAVIVVIVIGLAAALATGALGEMRAEPVRDHYRQPLPAGPLSGTDVHELRFGVTLRGYSMDQVDEVIDRLSGEIAERDRLLGVRAAGDRADLYRRDADEQDQLGTDGPDVSDEGQTPDEAEVRLHEDSVADPDSPEELRG